MKRSISCVGVDANPSSCFAARVKTAWSLLPEHLSDCMAEFREGYKTHCSDPIGYRDDPTYKYLEIFGFLERGWISEEPLRKVIAAKKKH